MVFKFSRLPRRNCRRPPSHITNDVPIRKLYTIQWKLLSDCFPVQIVHGATGENWGSVASVIDVISQQCEWAGLANVHIGSPSLSFSLRNVLVPWFSYPLCRSITRLTNGCDHSEYWFFMNEKADGRGMNLAKFPPPQFVPNWKFPPFVKPLKCRNFQIGGF